MGCHPVGTLPPLMFKVLAIFLILAATLLCGVVILMLFFSRSDSTPKGIKRRKSSMIGTGVTWFVGVGGSIVALSNSFDGWSVFLSGATIAVILIAFEIPLFIE